MTSSTTRLRNPHVGRIVFQGPQLLCSESAVVLARAHALTGLLPINDCARGAKADPCLGDRVSNRRQQERMSCHLVQLHSSLDASNQPPLSPSLQSLHLCLSVCLSDSPSPGVRMAWWSHGSPSLAQPLLHFLSQTFTLIKLLGVSSHDLCFSDDPD